LIFIQTTSFATASKVGCLSYRTNEDYEDFLNELREWAVKPFYMQRNFNRRDNKVNFCWDSKVNARAEKICIKDVAITIYPVAEKYLVCTGIGNLRERIAEILKLQRNATEQEKIDIRGKRSRFLSKATWFFNLKL
jgi:hypothetical protein